VLDQIEEVTEDNNSWEYPVFVYSSRISVSKPFEFQFISPEHVILQVNNPGIPAAEDSPRSYQFQIDTTRDFNSPLLILSPPIPEGKIVTRWTIDRLKDATTYFWRCRANEGSAVGDWVRSSFTTRAAAHAATWTQTTPAQFSANQFQQSEVTSRGMGLEARSFILKAESAGYTDGNYARISVNGVPVAEQHRGHNIAVIAPNTGEVVAYRSFDTWASSDEADAMANFINGLEPGSYVLCAVKDDGSYRMTEAAYQSLEGIGSRHCRDVGLRDSWAIIGIKGATVGSVAEMHRASGEGAAMALDTLINYYPAGSVVSPPIGPADGWNYVSWQQSLTGSGSNITLDVMAFDKKLSQWDTLVTGLSNFSRKDLNFIHPRKYPLIRLTADFRDDTGLKTPYLRRWSVAYAPVSDPAIGYDVVTLDRDTLMEGDELKIELDVYNVGMKIVDSVKIRFSLISPGYGTMKLGEELQLKNIAVDHFQSVSRTLEIAGTSGKQQFVIELDPDDDLNELSESNNFFSASIYVLADTVKPRVVVTYDGKSVVSGDYVSARPLILIDIYDNSLIFTATDTTQIELLLDNQRVSYAGNQANLTISPVRNSDEPDLRAQVTFTPELADGDHSLEVFARDSRNNLSYVRNDFQVVSEFKLLNVFNYPNPFRSGTEFTFQLTQPAERLTIKMYTVAGRLLRTLEFHHLEAGFHRIYWNGEDQDRNVMANGVYLYKVVARSGDRQVEQIEKFVIMR